MREKLFVPTGSKIEEFSLESFNSNLRDIYTKNPHTLTLEPTMLTTVLENESYEAKVIFGQYTIKNPEY